MYGPMSDIMNDIVKRGRLKKIKKLIVIKDLLKALNCLDPAGEQHGDEFWSNCPNPRHSNASNSWSINTNPENEKFGTHNCFSCGFKGNYITLTATRLSYSTGKEVDNEQAAEFIIKLFTLQDFDEDTIYDLLLEERKELKEQVEHEINKGPTESKLPTEFKPVTPEAKRYYRYLTKPIQEGGRGLTDDIIYKYNIGYCDTGLYSKRIIIPFIQEGKLISFIARSILKPIKSRKIGKKEYMICPKCGRTSVVGSEECSKCEHSLKNYVVKKARARYPKGSTMEFMMWSYDNLDHDLDYVILVEGAMDKLRLEVLGYKNVMCLFGNKVSDYHVELLTKHEQRINKKLRIFLFPDADEGGDILIEFANSKIKYLFDTKVVELPWKPDNWLDPGSATEKQIRIAFNKSEKLYKVFARKFEE